MPGNSGPSNISGIAAKVDPGLVDVNVTFGYQNVGGAGTGIVLTSDGEVLTNNHVIDGATKISVTDLGNGQTYPAAVVGYDSTHDIAVLQLQGASGLRTATLSKSAPTVGEEVVAIGNVGGRGGTPTTAGGSITGLNQSITASDSLDGTNEQLTGLIETNADVQEGDSGGSLVNSAGQVIGMDTAASSSYSFQSQSGTRDSPSRSPRRPRLPGRSSPAPAPRSSTSALPRSWACRSSPRARAPAASRARAARAARPPQGRSSPAW